MKNNKIGIIASVAVVALLLGFGVFLQSIENTSTKGNTNFISNKGLHWHSELTIMVKGVKQEIPTNLGLSGNEMAIHTHEEPGVIHMEFPGIVRQEDLLLGKFFQIWGKDIRSFGTNMKMTVNGAENTEFENYQMKDKDKIVLTFD